MKKKIIFAGLLAAVMTMMTSCLVVFPGMYDEGGSVVVENNSYEKSYISEVSYGRYDHDYSGQKWTVAWDDGHDYLYKSADRSTYGYSQTYKDKVYCTMPIGITDIRVTVIYDMGCGKLEYQDYFFVNQSIDYANTLYLKISDSGCKASRPL